MKASKAHIAGLEEKKRTLSELKKSLMHDLFTGAVRVESRSLQGNTTKS